VEISGGIQASLAGRYASALFGLARDEKQVDAVGRSIEALSQALAGSKELNQLVTSPLISRDEAGKAVAALASGLKLDKLTTNFLGVLTRNGRKSQLPQVIRFFRLLAADHRGETTAEVVSAHPLSDAQVAALKTRLKSSAGRDVTVDARTDPQILGGLIVRMGSQMIDASLKTKLNRLALAMKG
jgi:F-type H+-transporting ATPase subunit delta